MMQRPRNLRTRGGPMKRVAGPRRPSGDRRPKLGYGTDDGHLQQGLTGGPLRSGQPAGRGRRLGRASSRLRLRGRVRRRQRGRRTGNRPMPNIMSQLFFQR